MLLFIEISGVSGCSNFKHTGSRLNTSHALPANVLQAISTTTVIFSGSDRFQEWPCQENQPGEKSHF